MLDDGISSITSEDQKNLEQRIADIYHQLIDDDIHYLHEKLLLNRTKHAKYLYGGLGELPAGNSLQYDQDLIYAYTIIPHQIQVLVH